MASRCASRPSEDRWQQAEGGSRLTDVRCGPKPIPERRSDQPQPRSAARLPSRRGVAHNGAPPVGTAECGRAASPSEGDEIMRTAQDLLSEAAGTPGWPPRWMTVDEVAAELERL